MWTTDMSRGTQAVRLVAARCGTVHCANMRPRPDQRHPADRQRNKVERIRARPEGSPRALCQVARAGQTWIRKATHNRSGLHSHRTERSLFRVATRRSRCRRAASRSTAEPKSLADVVFRRRRLVRSSPQSRVLTTRTSVTTGYSPAIACQFSRKSGRRNAAPPTVAWEPASFGGQGENSAM